MHPDAVRARLRSAAVGVGIVRAGHAGVARTGPAGVGEGCRSHLDVAAGRRSFAVVVAGIRLAGAPGVLGAHCSRPAEEDMASGRGSD